MASQTKQPKQSTKPTDSTPTVDLKVEALGGLSAGIIGTVIGYPLDLVKTRMQTSALLEKTNTSPIPTKPTSTSTLTPKPQQQSTNLFQVGYKILRNEGISSLYKGMTPPLISLSILNTITFTSYNYIRIQYDANRGFDVRNFLAGFTIAPLCSTISTVEHLIKTQMQLDNVHQKRFRNSWHCLTTLVRENGGGSIRILYLGHGVNTIREGVFIGTYFYTYEGMRIKLDQIFGGDPNINNTKDQKQKAAAWTIPFAGGLSGAWAWFVSFPLDCVKAGVQGQSLQNGIHKLKGMNTIFTELMKEKGWRGLYAGVTPSIMRAFIVSSSRFTAYEMVVKLCDNYL